MRQININVIDKLPKITSMSGTAVSDNTYQFVFTFDDDWTDGTKTVYVVGVSGEFVPYIMDGNSLEIKFNDDRYIYIGVSQGTTVTSRSCKIEIKPSIKHNTGEEIAPPEPGIYDQIMQKLNEIEQSGVSPEQIAAAVEQYLTENPITAADVNAVAQNQGAEDAGKFLGINESGEVVPVESGADGITPHIGENGNWYIGETDTGIKAQGEKGSDGTTPHIGDNGDWYIGETDTGIKAQGEKGEKGDTGEKGTTPHIGENGNWWIGNTDTGVKADASGDYIPLPQTAAVGQYFRVSAVDENGVVTAVEAVDAPSGSGETTDISLGITGAAIGQTVKITAVNENGVPTAWESVDMAGGGSETWTQLCDAELTEESNQINQSWVSTPMKKIKVLIETPAASANTTYMPTIVYTEDIRNLFIGRFYPTALPLKEAANIEYIIEVYNINDTVYMRFTEYSGGIHGVNNGVKGVIKLKDIISVETTGNDTYGNVLFEKIIGIQLQSYSTFGVGTKIKIWGIAL